MDNVLILIVWALLGYWGYKVAEKKNREPIIGAVLGFCFGLLGILICYLIPKKNVGTESKTTIR